MAQRFIRAATLALLLAATAQAGDVKPATAVAAKKSVTNSPAQPARKARVAQNGEVELAVPTLSGAQLAAMRPHYEELKPRVRTNAE